MIALKKVIASQMLVTGMLAANSGSLSVNDFLSSSNLDIYIEDGIATLRGYAGTESDSLRAELAAERIEGVIEVRNLSSFS